MLLKLDVCEVRGNRIYRYILTLFVVLTVKKEAHNMKYLSRHIGGHILFEICFGPVSI
jgi:hypothetical protein